jgi:hypothetical protein
VVSQVVSDRLNIENTRESTHQLLFDLPLSYPSLQFLKKEKQQPSLLSALKIIPFHFVIRPNCLHLSHLIVIRHLTQFPIFS